MTLAEKALAGVEIAEVTRTELVALGRYLTDREF
jgi:hypothetical protein